eukprot:XP_027318692.1 LOW QUALITY PROTEIN: uncharacterized protein KIAA1614 homolog [Anas platyrhynchos]
MLGGHMEGGRRLEPGRAPRPPASPEPPRGGPHAVLESKVKALKEKRGTSRLGTPPTTTTTGAPPERPSPKKPRPRRGKPGVDATVAEPRAQLRTYLTDGLLDAGEPPEPPQGTRRVSGSSQQHPKEGSRGCAPPAADGGEVAAGWEPLSLAERVERNRRLLQEVLGLAAAGSAQEVLASDGDWDSGVSLQDAEGCRAFVPGQELELSPRHEQAKQLLQRARMKARTNPLRASHDLLLLPATPRPSREPSGTPRPSFVPREGEGPAGGSLSDSSSGESGCAPRRPRGPSPSRVRFEDESARDAEVRYLERLRHRRPLGSALERASSEAHAQLGAEAALQKPRAVTSPLGASAELVAPSLGLLSRPKAAPWLVDGSVEGLEVPKWSPKPGPWVPGSPLWILPSRQRIHTEKIKETYIGDARRADEADSALESTDTSDSCRTDSEEVGPRSPHPRAHRDPRARGHRTPRAPAQKEARAGKGASVASSPRAGAGGSGAPRPPPSGSRDATRPAGSPAARPGARGAPPHPACASRTSPPATPRCATWSACGTAARWARRWSAPAAKPTHSWGTEAALQKPRAVTSPLGASAELVAPSLGLLSRPKAAPWLVDGSVEGLEVPKWSPKPGPWVPGGSPLWILPSRQRIHTEKIKETYIGDARRADEADSALESTDTSDSCRTDSEEVGPRSPHPRAHRDPRARGHRTPRAPAQKEARAGKGASVASSPRAGAGGSGAPRPPPSGSRDGGDPAEAPGSGEPPAPSSQPAGGPRVPAPPVAGATTTKKACSQVPCRKNLASSRRCPEPDAGGASPKPEGAGQRRGPCGPIWLPGSPLRALSTNNCNNTRGQDGRGTGGGGALPQPGAEPSGDAAGMPRAQQDGSTAPGEPARVVSRKGSGASASSGLKKLLSSLSQSTKQRLGRFRCYSMEQLPAPGSSPGVERSPSLQSLVSPFCQPRKAASTQSLQALLGKAPRASAYLLPQPGPGDRTGASGPRRSLSVEDIGAPGLPRTVGRVVEVFPDGTSQLELQRPPHGSFGFLLTSGHGRPDTGVYVQEMSDAGTAKLYAGLLGVGDEILQVNGAAVSGLGLARIRELLLHADSLSLRVLRQRPARR